MASSNSFSFLVYPVQCSRSLIRRKCSNSFFAPWLPDGFNQKIPIGNQNNKGKLGKDIYFLSFFFRSTDWLVQLLFTALTPLSTLSYKGPSLYPLNLMLYSSLLYYFWDRTLFIKVLLCHTHISVNSLFINFFLQTLSLSVFHFSNWYHD